MSKRPKLVDLPWLVKETSFDRKTVERHLHRAGVKPARSVPANNGTRRLYDRARALRALNGALDIATDQDAIREAKADIMDEKLKLESGAYITTERALADLHEALKSSDTIFHARATAAVPYIVHALRDHPKGSPERRAAIEKIVAEIMVAAEQPLRELRARYAEAGR